MRLSVLVIAALALTGSGASQDPVAASTPQECIAKGRAFVAERRKAAGPLTLAIVQSIDAEKVKVVRACGAGFDVEKATGHDLTGLIEFYMEAQQPDLADRALFRALAENTTTEERAERLAGAVRMLLRQPKSDARNAKAEGYLDQLDALGEDAFDQKAAAHIALNNYYRADDIDAGIIKHSTWLIEAGRRPEARKKYGSSLINAYVHLAEALAGEGENDRAVDLLKRAPVELAGVANVESRTKDTLERYLLVGTPAAPIAPTAWLNRDAAAGPLDLRGSVTLVQFTAHWCGPCRESYPGMQRLRERFKGRPFQVVFYTRTYGYFENERPLTSDEEIARDRKYFADYGFDIPIAVGAPSSTMVDGKQVYPDDPIEKAFQVSGIPQINLVDAKGRIRLIMIGYDDANEARLAGFIDKLLAEK